MFADQKPVSIDLEKQVGFDLMSGNQQVFIRTAEYTGLYIYLRHSIIIMLHKGFILWRVTMFRKSVLPMVTLAVLTGCAQQQDGERIFPWWGWLIVFVILAVIVWLIFRGKPDRRNRKHHYRLLMLNLRQYLHQLLHLYLHLKKPLRLWNHLPQHL